MQALRLRDRHWPTAAIARRLGVARSALRRHLARIDFDTEEAERD